MTKSLTRIAVLLLVPCLVVDPSTVSGFGGDSFSRSVQSPVTQLSPFKSQALTLAFAASVFVGASLHNAHPFVAMFSFLRSQWATLVLAAGAGATLIPLMAASSGPVPLKPRILLAEDDEEIRIPAKRFFESNGFDVVAAEDGAVAWQLFQTEKFDVVITDGAMPHMSGEGLIKKIREQGSKILIVFTSGDYERNDQVEIDYPDVRIVPKPYDREILTDLKQWLSPIVSVLLAAVSLGVVYGLSPLGDVQELSMFGLPSFLIGALIRFDIIYLDSQPSNRQNLSLRAA